MLARTLKSAIIVASLLLGFLEAPARAGQILLGITFKGQLMSINLTTAEATLIGKPIPIGNKEFTDLAVTGGNIYTYEQDSNLLVQINPKDATIISANVLGNRNRLYGEGAMTFDSNGTGYLRSGHSDEPFYSLTLAPKPVASPVNFNMGKYPRGPGMDGLAFINDTLYGMTDPGKTGNRLYTIDPTTGEYTFKFNIVDTATKSIIGKDFLDGGLAYDTVGKHLYAVTSNADVSQLYMVNPANGAATLVGDIHTKAGKNIPQISGIAFLSTPEPTALILLSQSCALLLGGWAWRRRRMARAHR